MDRKFGYDSMSMSQMSGTMGGSLVERVPANAESPPSSDDDGVIERGAKGNQTCSRSGEAKPRPNKDAKPQPKSPEADEANVIERGAKESKTCSQTDAECRKEASKRERAEKRGQQEAEEKSGEEPKPQPNEDEKTCGQTESERRKEAFKRERAEKRGQQEAEEKSGEEPKPQPNEDETPKAKSPFQDVPRMPRVEDMKPLKTSGKDIKELLKKTGHDMKGLYGAEKIDILAMMFQQLKGVIELPKEQRVQMELDQESLENFLVLEDMPAKGTNAKQVLEMLSELRVLQLARLAMGYGSIRGEPSEAEKEAASEHQRFKQCLEVCVLEEVEDIFGQSMR